MKIHLSDGLIIPLVMNFKNQEQLHHMIGHILILFI